MPRIYLICRSDETINLSDYMLELLRARYGPQNVARGSVARSVGDYPGAVERDLRRSDVALVVIGPSWLTNPGADGRPWLTQPDDPTRIALATALRLGLLIAPVLSDGATMPAQHDLPPDLSKLPQYQAIPVRPAPFFAEDMTRLYRQINTKLTWRPASIPLAVLAALTALAWIAFAGAVLSGKIDSTISPVTTIMAISLTTATTTLLVALSLAVRVAIVRKSWKWLWAIGGLTALTVFSLLPTPANHLQNISLGLLLITLVAFALVGPRRETAYG